MTGPERLAEDIAHWIGKAREAAPELTDEELCKRIGVKSVNTLKKYAGKDGYTGAIRETKARAVIQRCMSFVGERVKSSRTEDQWRNLAIRALYSMSGQKLLRYCRELHREATLGDALTEFFDDVSAVVTGRLTADQLAEADAVSDVDDSVQPPVPPTESKPASPDAPGKRAGTKQASG